MIEIHPAKLTDLPKINEVVLSAVMNWPAPHRLKRLAATVLQYDNTDLENLEVLVATFRGEIVGAAVWDPSPNHQLPNGNGGLFHGLFVLPIVRGQGIGKRLMDTVFAKARAKRTRGLLIKAQRVSRTYFEHQKLDPLAANDDEYPWQYWKRLA